MPERASHKSRDRDEQNGENPAIRLVHCALLRPVAPDDSDRRATFAIDCRGRYFRGRIVIAARGAETPCNGPRCSGVRWRSASSRCCWAQRHFRNRPRPREVAIEPDGTVHVPEQTVPVSGFLSPEGKAYLAEHLRNLQRPEMLVQENGVPRLIAGYIARQRELFPVDREETTIGGVHAYVYTPRGGIAAENRDRVLIDLHGGGFRECWPACAELESMPIAALGRIKVVAPRLPPRPRAPPSRGQRGRRRGVPRAC